MFYCEMIDYSDTYCDFREVELDLFLIEIIVL